MDLRLDDVDNVPETARCCQLSSRCSVFMKSDCTHQLNKGEATKADIVLSLSDVMATKVVDFLKRARIKSGRVLLTGGVTQNRYIIRFIREQAARTSSSSFRSEAPYFEAYGAALLAANVGEPPPGARTSCSSRSEIAVRALQEPEERRGTR